MPATWTPSASSEEAPTPQVGALPPLNLTPEERAKVRAVVSEIFGTTGVAFGHDDPMLAIIPIIERVADIFATRIEQHGQALAARYAAQSEEVLAVLREDVQTITDEKARILYDANSKAISSGQAVMSDAAQQYLAQVKATVQETHDQAAAAAQNLTTYTKRIETAVARGILVMLAAAAVIAGSAFWVVHHLH